MVCSDRALRAVEIVVEVFYTSYNRQEFFSGYTIVSFGLSQATTVKGYNTLMAVLDLEKDITMGT